jgi:virginiamycin A acetyltransferase
VSQPLDFAAGPQLTSSRWKDAVRPLLLAGLKRLLVATDNSDTRQAIFRRIRRVDRDDRFSRHVMKEVFGVEIGRYTYGAFVVDGSINPGTTIGAFCSVAAGVRLGGSRHPLTWVSTHPFLYLANRGFVDEDDTEFMRKANLPVVIEDDVWLGLNAIVLPGVRVGRGAAVAAGAVVTRDVEPYTLVAGVPARVVRHRIDEGLARRLLQIDWPSWSDATLRESLESFYDVELFLERYGNEGT